MTISKLIKFGLILLIIVLAVILLILMDFITLPIETTMTITTTTVAMTTTTIKKMTTTLTTTTIPIIIYKSYCENNKCWLYEGESLNVTKNNIKYSITLLGVSNDNTVGIDVNGDSVKFNQGEDKVVKGLDIYLMKVFYLPKEGQLSFVQFLFY